VLRGRAAVGGRLTAQDGASAVALEVDLLVLRGIVHDSVDCRERHRLIRENPSPFSQRLFSRFQHRSALVSGGDGLEEHAVRGLVLRDVGEVVKERQVVAVKFGNALPTSVRVAHLEALYEAGCAREEGAASVLHEGVGEAEGRRQMALATARRSKDKDIGALLELGIAGRKCHHLVLREHWHGFKVKRGERCAHR
jgi:hypothetical protein